MAEKKKLPPLEMLVEQNSKIKDCLNTMMALQLAGYTMEDFRAYIDEQQKDSDVKVVLDALGELLRVVLNQVMKEE